MVKDKRYKGKRIKDKGESMVKDESGTRCAVCGTRLIRFAFYVSRFGFIVLRHKVQGAG